MDTIHLCLYIDEQLSYFFNTNTNIIIKLAIIITLLSTAITFYFIYIIIMIPNVIIFALLDLIKLKNHIISYYKINKILHIIPKDIVQIIHEYKYEKYEDNVKLICNCRFCYFINLCLKHYI